MDRRQFLDKLRNQLKHLPQDEINNILRYYNEYFDDAVNQDEQQIISDLGDPEELAKQISMNYSTKYNFSEKKTKKSGISSLWWFLLGIFSFPVTIPVFILLFIIIVFVLAILIAIIGLLFTGIGVTVVSIGSVFYHIPTMLLFIGIAMVFIGLPILLISFIISVCKYHF